MDERLIKNSITITTKKISKKSKKIFPFYGSVEKWTNKLMHKLNMPLCKSRIVIDRILKWVFKFRKQNVVIYQKTFKKLKKVINKNINYTASIPDINDELNYNFLKFILGQSYYSKYTEPFYTDTVYKPLSSMNKIILEINENGKIMNLFQPFNIELPELSWYCNEMLCNLNYTYAIPRVIKIVKHLLSTPITDFPNIIKNIDLCTSQARQSYKLGHTLSCYIDFNCSSILLFLNNLGPHYPSIRKIVSCIYKMQSAQKNILKINNAIYSLNINILTEMEKKPKNQENVII